jgi:hypothetical protein
MKARLTLLYMTARQAQNLLQLLQGGRPRLSALRTRFSSTVANPAGAFTSFWLVRSGYSYLSIPWMVWDFMHVQELLSTYQPPSATKAIRCQRLLVGVPSWLL